MGNGYADKQDVRDMADDVITRVSELMAVEREHRQQQHNENQVIMREIRADVRVTNGRVTKLEVAVQSLEREFLAIRGRWHDFRQSVQDILAKAGTAVTGEASPVTRLDAKTAVAIYILGMGTIMALMKLIQAKP